MSSTITIHMVASLDGFIAARDNSISWMQSKDRYEKGITLTKKYIADFLKTIDCYVMGSRSYEHVLKLGWPYGETPVVVLTRRNLSCERKNVAFYSGDLDYLIHDRLKASYSNIWVVGGAELTKSLLRQDLADKIILSVMPVILGEGTLFFDFIGKELQLHLLDTCAFKNGMVELSYEVIKS